MRRIALLALFVGFLAPFLASAPAHAQATRTWVSGVGDDANPCSRTAPCKTFAGAISKTAVAGEIDCLDPGGFGAVTITKSITLNCHEVLGSILVAGTPAIVINAGAADRVIIRNLMLQGVNTGTVGINILSAAVVSIEDCIVTQFTAQGIADQRTAGNTKLFVRNTTLSHNAGSGIGVGAAATNNVELENVFSVNNLFGVAVGPGNNVMIRRSVFSGNSNAGVDAESGSAINVDNSAISGNATGVAINGGTVRLSNSDISFNGTGINGATTSFGNNRISGNGSPGTAPTAAGGASSAFGQQ
ncbi:Right handed beta helix region [Bradyrhizobium erythrophlei]|nr:Right handed beta helix region [Bradyrhizobium erythrophlei]